MEQLSNGEWAALVREGCAGNASAFQLRLSRLIARLRREKSPLAGVLSTSLQEVNEARLTLARDASVSSATLTPVDADSNLPLTTFSFPAVVEHRPVWTPEIESGLAELIHEWQEAPRLREAGLEPSHTLLLSGPPGVGKTLAATFVAEQLGLPLLTLNLAATVNSFLGKTGNNLTKVLSHARTHACVLLLDEFDAFAKRRDDGQDVGEFKRVVNVLLQAIDDWPSTSLLVAATNHEELLDRALFRRFDMWLRFPPSTRTQVENLMVHLGCSPMLAKRTAPALAGLPLSDTVRVVTRARRQVALHDNVSFEKAVLQALNPPGMDEKMKRFLAIKQMAGQGKSMREIAKRMGVNASTVSRWLKQEA